MDAEIRVRQPVKMPPLLAKAAMRQEQRRIACGSINVQIQGELARIEMPARFDFQLWRSFYDVYMPLLDDDTVKKISVGMSGTNYMDSSAMGMLLLLNERVRAANKTLTLFSASDFVSRVLKVANFSKVFNIGFDKASSTALPS